MKISSQKTFIATFGDGESLFALTAEAVASLNGISEPVQEAFLTRSDVQKVIDAYAGQKDPIFDAAGLHRKTLTSALLLDTVMKQFQIVSLHFSRTVGSTSGMLIDPQLWNN